MKTFTLNSLLGNIVATFPGAGDYFIGKQIDFCCGGDRSLGTAIEEQDELTVRVLEELNILYADFQERRETFTDWAKEGGSKLIEHIEVEHHEFLRRELEAISALLFKLLGVHGQSHEELFQIHATYNALRAELEAHLVKEEIYLFPVVRDIENKVLGARVESLVEVLNELEGEHDGAGDALKKLRELTDHYTAPADACPTYKLTFDKLRALEKNTFEHVHLENNVLFKQYK